MEPSLTKDELIGSQRKLQKDMEDLIDSFHQETGFTVTDIELTTMTITEKSGADVVGRKLSQHVKCKIEL